jgi:hypothetical protein
LLVEHGTVQREFLTNELQPALDDAQAGQGHVFFVDAVPCVL